MTEMEFRELAEQTISYLYDNGLLGDFLEDRNIDFDERKQKYFNVVVDNCDYDYDDNWIDGDY